MGAFLPLLGGLAGSQLLGPKVTDWLGGPTTTTPPSLPILGPIEERGVSSADFTLSGTGAVPTATRRYGLLSPEERAGIIPELRPQTPPQAFDPENFSILTGAERTNLPGLPQLAQSNPAGTTFGIANETLGPILAGLAGSLALGALPLPGMGKGGEEAKLPPPPGLRQQSFGNIPTPNTKRPTLGSPKGYVGQAVGRNLTADEWLRLFRSARG